MENTEIKEEILEEILPSSTVENTCSVYINEEDVKVEITETQGKINKNIFLLLSSMLSKNFFLLNFVFIYFQFHSIQKSLETVTLRKIPGIIESVEVRVLFTELPTLPVP